MIFLKNFKKVKKIPKLWVQCPISKKIIFINNLKRNMMISPYSNFYFPLNAHERCSLLIDKNTFKEYDADIMPSDPLNFHFFNNQSYKQKILEYQKKTKLNEAVISGIGSIEGLKVSIAIMDFNFLGGSMGTVVGEKITKSIERAIHNNIPLIIICASGGARMHEGIFSLMQMSKTISVLSNLKKKNIPYISILTNPTMGGVTASFALLADIILAEPKALIGFAGPRVIKETIYPNKLPDGFQTSEFLLKHGLIDQIITRQEMKKKLFYFLKILHYKK